MSKIVIFLCAFLFASLANAYNMSEKYEIRQRDVEYYVKDKIKHINEKLNDTKLIATKATFQSLYDKHKEQMDYKMNETIQQAYRGASEYIKGIIKKDTVIRECVYKVNGRLITTAQRAKNEVSKCIFDHFNSDLELNMKRSANETSRRLTNLNKKALKCGSRVNFSVNEIRRFNSVDGPQGSSELQKWPAFRAIICTNKVLTEILLTAALNLEFLSASIEILNDRLLNANELFRRCEERTPNYLHFSRISSSAVTEAQECPFAGLT